MKEIMYSGVDSLDGQQALIWVQGDKMAVSLGRLNGWRNREVGPSRGFSEYATSPLDLTRFTDLKVVWER